jgi:serine/threonine-protein kinase RsbW
MKSYSLSIGSTKKNIAKVEELLNDANKEFHLDEDKFQRFQIAVSELIMNAIVHGNKEQISRQVKIFIKHNKKKVTVRVIDEGEGFDIDSIPDPSIKENITKLSGRGLFIVRSLVDEFSYKHTRQGSTFILSILK